MKIAIIGGTGFIGAHVTSQLAELGHELLVFHRGKHLLKEAPNVTTLLGERQNLSVHSEAFRQFNPEVVVDVIGFSRHDAQELVKTFEHGTARVVVISSGDVYRNRTGLFGPQEFPPDPLPLSENSPVRSRLYPHADHTKPFDLATSYEKLEVEGTLNSALSGRVTVLRLPAIYGPGDAQHRLWSYLKRMQDQRPFILVEKAQANWRWTRGYIENVAAAVVASVLNDTGRNEIYNVGEDEFPSEAEWITRIAKAVDWKGKIVPLLNENLPSHLRTTFDWSYGFGMDTQKLKTSLNFTEPVSIQDAMEKTIEWESQNPPLTPNPQDTFDYASEDEAVRASS